MNAEWDINDRIQNVSVEASADTISSVLTILDLLNQKLQGIEKKLEELHEGLNDND